MHIGLTEMHSIGTDCQSHIDSVVDDQRNRGFQGRKQFSNQTRFSDKVPDGAVLFPELDAGDAAANGRPDDVDGGSSLGEPTVGYQVERKIDHEGITRC